MKNSKKVILISAVVALAVSIPVLTYASQKPLLHPYVSQDEYSKLPKEKKDDVDKQISRIEDAKSGKIKQADKSVVVKPESNSYNKVLFSVQLHYS